MSPRSASRIRDDFYPNCGHTHLIHDFEGAPFDAGCDRNHPFAPVSHDRTSSLLKVCGPGREPRQVPAYQVTNQSKLGPSKPNLLHKLELATVFVQCLTPPSGHS